MLASVYSYRVKVKSVSSGCVCVRRVLSNPVTYLLYIFNWEANKMFLLIINGRPTSNPYFKLCNNRNIHNVASSLHSYIAICTVNKITKYFVIVL